MFTDFTDSSFLGPFCAFGSSVTWAFGSSVYSNLSKDYSSFAINFSRALVALPLFVISAFLLSGGFSEGLANYQQLTVGHWGWLSLSMLASYGLGDCFFFWSTRSLGISGALAIASCFPLLTLAFGYFFANEKVSSGQVLGIFIAISGVVLVILNSPHRGSEVLEKGRSWRRGLCFALLAALAWATNGICVAKGGVGLLPPVGNTVRMFVALILTAGFGRFLAPGAKMVLPGKKISKFLWVFVLEAFGGSYFYLYGLSHSPLALGATLASLAPVISVPVAWGLRLEKFSLFRTLGVVLAFLGICFLIEIF